MNSITQQNDAFTEALRLVSCIEYSLAGGYSINPKPMSNRDEWFSTKLLEVIKQAEFIRDNPTDISCVMI